MHPGGCPDAGVVLRFPARAIVRMQMARAALSCVDASAAPGNGIRLGVGSPPSSGGAGAPDTSAVAAARDRPAVAAGWAGSCAAAISVATLPLPSPSSAPLCFGQPGTTDALRAFGLATESRAMRVPPWPSLGWRSVSAARTDAGRFRNGGRASILPPSAATPRQHARGGRHAGRARRASRPGHARR